MRRTEASKIHFYLLVIGTVFYLLFSHRGLVIIGNGAPQLAVRDFAFLCKNTVLYLAFIVLVFGHALLWRSQTFSLSDADKEQ